MEPWGIVALSVAGFVGVWGLILWLVRQVSGWDRLLRAYRWDGREPPAWSGWLSGRVGGANFNRTLWLAATPQALFLGVAWPFSLLAGPLRIPAGDLEVERVKGWLGMASARLRAARVPGWQAQFFGRAAELVLAAYPPAAAGR